MMKAYTATEALPFLFEIMLQHEKGICDIRYLKFDLILQGVHFLGLMDQGPGQDLKSVGENIRQTPKKQRLREFSMKILGSKLGFYSNETSKSEGAKLALLKICGYLQLHCTHANQVPERLFFQWFQSIHTKNIGSVQQNLADF